MMSSDNCFYESLRTDQSEKYFYNYNCHLKMMWSGLKRDKEGVVPAIGANDCDKIEQNIVKHYIDIV